MAALSTELVFIRIADAEANKDSATLFKIGVELSESDPANKDRLYIERCFRAAALMDHIPSMYNLGTYLADKQAIKPNNKQDYADAVYWFKKAIAELTKKAAIQGSFKDLPQILPEALNNLGACLLHDASKPGNRGEAISCFRQSAELGCTKAAENLRTVGL